LPQKQDENKKVMLYHDSIEIHGESLVDFQSNGYSPARVWTALGFYKLIGEKLLAKNKIDIGFLVV
jgi:hypothetical protein